MKFDRTAPGNGVEAVCRLENGKAFLEWEFYFDECVENCGREHFIRLILTDMQGETVLEGIQLADEEEPLQSVLLDPILWRGTAEPYLYNAEVILADQQGRCLDRVVRQLPLRSVDFVETSEGQKILLNGKTLMLKSVCYDLPSAGTGPARQQQMLEDLRKLSELGANSVCVEENMQEIPAFFRQLCNRLGFLIFFAKEKDGNRAWMLEGKHTFRIQWEEQVPFFHGKKDSLFLLKNSFPTSLYYRYRAKWSGKPFVHIDPESVKKTDSGNYTVHCYSNCSRVALHSDGILFEFQKGDTEFVFREVPARTPCLMLTAEGDGCRESLSIHKSFAGKSLRR